MSLPKIQGNIGLNVCSKMNLVFNSIIPINSLSTRVQVCVCICVWKCTNVAVP